MDTLSPELLHGVLESSYDGIMVFDSHMNLVYSNDKALELNGLSREEAKGKTWYELEAAGYFHGKAAPEAMATGKTCSYEFVNQLGLQLLSTSTPVFDKNGTSKYCISNLRDISKLAELQKKFVEQNKQLVKLRNTLNEITSSNEKKLVYASAAFRKLISTLDRIAPTDVSVLLLGESGVGKSAVAERIHKKSQRASGPLIVVNCGAIPHSLCEAEFFGHEKGAFTGANRSRAGIFESANNGTLVLDEVGELPLDIQVKLLRVLQSKKVKRIGSQKEVTVDFRLIAATNQNLKEKVANGTFREDLYYRINIVKFVIPPLRERVEDVKYLIMYYLDYYNKKYSMHKTMSSCMVSRLEHYSWPGNTRELSHLIERMVVLSTTDIIGVEYIDDEISMDHDDNETEIMILKDAVENIEKKLITAAYKKYKNTRSMAKVLQVSHSTVARKMNEYGIK